MSGTTQDTGNVEMGSESVVGSEPSIDSESASEAYPVEVAEELAGELVETEASVIRIVGRTIQVRTDSDEFDERWKIHRAGIDSLFEWGYRAVDPDTVSGVSGDEWVSVFRLKA